MGSRWGFIELKESVMPEHDPATILLIHNKWANTQIMTACASMSEDDFKRSFEMGMGSLYATMVHIGGAMRGWSDLLAGRGFRARAEEASYERAALVAMLDEAADELMQLAKAHPMDEIVTRERGGQEYSFARGAVITHVTTHGMHHRAQCLNMMRHLGVTELPRTSVVEWTLMGEGR